MFMQKDIYTHTYPHAQREIRVMTIGKICETDLPKNLGNGVEWRSTTFFQKQQCSLALTKCSLEFLHLFFENQQMFTTFYIL